MISFFDVTNRLLVTWLNFSDLLATGNGTFNNGQMNGSGGSASNFPSVGNFEIGTFNISNSRGGGGGKCFVHPIFRFWFLVTFGDKVTKIRKYYVIFVYILQGKMGKTEKNRKENHATKVTKMPKTKRRKYGMNETLEL